MMRCHFCRGDLEKSTTEYVEKMDNFIVVIENIPCDKCVQCGEAYFSDEVFGKLERILNSIQRFGLKPQQVLTTAAESGEQSPDCAVGGLLCCNKL